MMLRYSFSLVKEAEFIENAVSLVLDEGGRTIDIMNPDEGKALTTTGMTEKILEKI
jgi:3-isopropylmalate dehydrogenase